MNGSRDNPQTNPFGVDVVGFEAMGFNTKLLVSGGPGISSRDGGVTERSSK